MFAKVRTMRKIIILLLILSAFLLPWSYPARAAELPKPAKYVRPPANETEEIELSLRSSPDSTFRSVIRFRSKRWSGWFGKLEALDTKTVQAASYSYIELVVKQGSGRTVYRWNETDDFLAAVSADGASLQAFRVPRNMAQALESMTAVLQKAHYGMSADWPAANRLLPRKAYLTITDLETGLTFRGQRRAGSAHADVQPVTKADSAIMKEIYGGHWSWDRRAILVESPEGLIAASMHGMPHGGDGIPGNNFDGHFCIHFDGTVTHGSKNSDPAHQAMVHKAAGKLEAYHRSLTPDQLVELFLVASNQKDAHLLRLLLNPQSPDSAALESMWLDKFLQSARRMDAPEGAEASIAPASDMLTVALRTRISLLRTGSRSQTFRYVWHLSRPAAGKAWVVDRIELDGGVR